MIGNKGAHSYYGNMDPVLKCKSCHYFFKSFARLENHKCTYCDKCAKVFSSYQKLKEHKLKCGKDVICVDCQKVFSSSVRLKQHKCTFCAVCEKIFSSGQKLKTHVCTRKTSKVKEASGDAIVTKVDNLTYLFKPVHYQWQVQRCAQLGLTVVKHHAQQPEDHLGPPSQIQHVVGDGNCFFRAISIALCGDQNSYKALRDIMIQYMLLNPRLFQRLLPEGMDVNLHIQQTLMHQDAVWATQVEIYAMASVLKTDIFIYTTHGRSWEWLKHTPQMIQPGLIVHNNAIYLKHTGLNHYDFVQTVASKQNVCTLTYAFRKDEKRTVKQEIDSKEPQEKLHLKNKDYKQIERDRKRQQRKDNFFREKERDKKRFKRQDKDFKEKERNARNLQRKKNREDTGFKEKERNMKRLEREDKYFREKERNARNPQRQKIREDREYREKERNARNPQRQKKRDDKGLREKERNMKRLEREDKNFREKERNVKNPQRRKKRKDREYREKERNARNPQRQTKREDKSFREKERNMKRLEREDKNFREKERNVKNPQRQKKRKDREYREKERNARNLKRRKKRSNLEEKNKEYEKRNWQRNLKRKYPAILKEEYKVRNEQRKKRRKNPVVKTKQRHTDRKSKIKQRAKLNSLESKINIFRELLKRGDDFVCTCCDQTFYQHSVYLVSRSSYESKGVPNSLLDLCLLGSVSCSNSEWICKTCHKYLCEERIPPMSKANGFTMFDLPEDIKKLNPTDTEERCAALRIPFMQIKQLGCGKQFGLYGNTVNVPMNPADVIHVLPRRFEETDTIHLEFKRRLNFKSAFAHETVRPKVIYDLCQYLIQTSELYKEEGIQLNTDWFIEAEKQEEEEDFVSAEDKVRLGQPGTEGDKDKDKDCRCNLDDDWSEVNEEEVSTGNRDTMLQNLDFTDDGKHALQIAPGEKNHPVSLYMDTYAEEKSFPVLFAGKKRQSNTERMVPVKYSTVCKAELRNKDRRFAMSIPNLFFKLKKLQTLQVKDAALTALRKTKGNEYTASQFKKKDAINELIRHDEGYSILRTIRSSPPYYQGKQKELFALIRQLGMPTFFATFSAAETRWLDLLNILHKKVEGIRLPTEQLQNLNWMQKASLIQKDPVTCSRHFHYRSQLFLNNILRTGASPIGEVEDFFIRVEFQQRGSPHLHCLFWVKGAPAYGSSPEKDIIEFIDNTISCTSEVSEEDKQYVQLQCHKHTQSCKKMGMKECRFGFPLPPMKETLLLEPLPKETEKTAMELHKKNFQKVNEVINGLPADSDMQFETFLEKCSIDYTSYILAIRSGLKRKQVLLKRCVSDVRINSYNISLLRIWKANSDLQFVIDPWAVCAYIASYMMKSQRGMSKLLQHACDEARAGNHGVKEKMRIIGNKFLNHCEVSGQEASYLLEQRPLTQCSRDVVFINTSPPSQRVHILKPKELLDALPDDSTEVTCSGLLERYAERPKALRKFSLAEYASYFQRYPRKRKTLKEDEDFSDRTDINVEEVEEGQEFLLENGDRLVRRKVPKGIRYVGYSEQKDPELYYREHLMLFCPWEDEMCIMGSSGSYEEQYKKFEKNIKAVKAKFDKCGDALAAAQQEIEEEVLLEKLDSMAPVARQSEEDAEALKKDSDGHGVLQPGKQHKTYDIGLDLGCSSSTHQEVAIKHKYSDEDYRKLVQSLNDEQKHFFNHVLHSAKTKTEPFYYFLSGGAGVGKSHVLKAIYQALLRYYDTVSGENPDEVKIVIGAVTAKSAFNVRGNTLHSLFSIPANQSLKSYLGLGHSALNSLRCQYSKLRLLIIDEISMVGLNMFNFVDSRLQEIFGTTQPFGGLSLLLVGDMFQLRPVLDGWVFVNSDHGYGPLAVNTWQDLVQLYELKTIMRQKDDVPFANVLNRIREGQHTAADMNVIRSRIILPEHHSKLSAHLHLFSTNLCVDAHNTAVLESLSTEGCVSVAVDFTIGDVPKSVRQTVLELAKDLKPQKTQNLVQQLQLKLSAQYMIVQNIDTVDGLTNGAPCTLMQFQLSNGKPHTVWVNFLDRDIGQKARRENIALYTPEIDKQWTPIFVIDRQFQVGRYKNVQVIRRQFPLKPSSAITVHKSQGMSVSNVVVSFRGRRVQHHMLYVALSRVTSLQGLHLLDFSEKNITVDANVIKEMHRLRTTRALAMQPSPLKPEGKKINILCHNARSLHKHIDDIKSDVNIPHTSILIIQETWAMEKDADAFYHIPGLHLVYKFYSKPNSQTRPHCGTFVYLKPHITLVNVHEIKHHLVEGLFLQLKKDEQIVQVLSLYKHPKGKVSTLIDAIQSIPFTKDTLVILGDINLDHLKPTSQLECLQNFLFDNLHAQPLLKEETTDSHSCIDQIYCTHEDAECGTLEAYWSDHKMIWVAL